MTDLFTMSVIQSALEAVAAEMFTVLRKTAMSPIIYEVLDVGTGVTDGEGNLISSGAGIPSFVGVLDKSVKFITESHQGKICNGDIFITNDPNFGGVTHLNDIVIAKPVFFDSELVAWTASIAHWPDIGGKVPGSMAADAQDIFAEGIRLPAIKLFDKGQKIESIFDIVLVNSRLPENTQGDLWSQIAAGNVAERKILSLYKSYGKEAVQDSVQELISLGRRRALDGLAKLPKGKFDIEEPQDDGSIWRASILIDAKNFTVDLRGNPTEIQGPYNTSRDGAIVSCQMIFKALCDSDRFANAGSFEPLVVLTEPTTIFDAGPTAAHGYYFETRIRLFDMLMQCMARAVPDLLPAGSFSSIFGTVIVGTHPDNGREFAMVEPQMGGWGATNTRNGMNAMFSTSHGDTFNCPVEVCESRYGLTVNRKQLGEKPETASNFAGGRGVFLEYELRGSASLSVGYTRAVIPVWSKDTDSHGGRNSLKIMRSDGMEENYQFVGGLKLNQGDRILIDTAFGGHS